LNQGAGGDRTAGLDGEGIAEQTLEQAADEVGAPLPPLAPGATLGRFRIIGELGAGGMGVVIEAYDPTLDRHVALKRVRDGQPSPTARDRLIGEAQAMARLSHPNVIPVHGVETLDGQVYIIMELIRGQTLEAWSREPRSWREIVEVFCQAGEGLAAAHRAGLVHRDFKPSNVLIDSAGHVRVGDFGLARDEQGASASAPTREWPAGSTPARPAGTPGYMAPEQRAGGVVDARADQYALARSLQHALANTHPPRRITAALAKAQRADRERRFPLLQDLLDELAAALETRRRTAKVASAIAVAAAGLAAASWLTRPAPETCSDGVALVDSVWSGAARLAQARSFGAARPQAATAVASTELALDEWAASWRLGRKSACRAEPAHRPARLACLDRDLAELRAQLATWSRADASVVDLAPSAVAGLPSPAACASLTRGGGSPAASALMRRIAEVNAATRAGQSAEVKARLPALLADTSGDAQLAALALLAAGTVEKELGDFDPAREHLAAAARHAGGVGDDDTLVQALLGEAAVATEKGRPQDGLGLLDAADAAAARGHLELADRIAWARGGALLEAGREADAVTELTRAVGLLEARAHREPAARFDLAAALGRLAAAESRQGDFAKARDLLQRALGIERQVLGDDHPEHAKTLHDLAQYEAELRRWDVAISTNRQARAIFVKAYGPDHRLTIATDISLAGIELMRAHDDAARQIFEKVLADMARTFRPDDPFFEVVEDSLGSLERDAGRCAAAIPHFRRAVELIEEGDRGGPVLAWKLTNLGACLSDVGDRARARPVIERALQILEANAVPLVSRREPMAILADLEAAEGHRDRAIELARRAITAVEQALAAHPADPDPDHQAFLRAEREKLARWRP
jgi:eukaryotic-like serine/threonine-protein kinase